MKDNNREQMIIASNNYKYPESVVSTKELVNNDNYKHHRAVRDIAALIMLDAAVSERLCVADSYAEAEDYEMQEKAMNDMFIKISFGDYSASVDLRCEDTLCAFGHFISEAIYNLEVLRS